MSFWLNHIDLADAKSARFVYEPALYLLSTSVFVRLFLVYVQFSKVPRVNPLRRLTRQVFARERLTRKLAAGRSSAGHL